MSSQNELALAAEAVRNFTDALMRIRSNVTNPSMEMAAWTDFIKMHDATIQMSPHLMQVIGDLSKVLASTAQGDEPTEGFSPTRSSGRLNDLRRLRSVDHIATPQMGVSPEIRTPNHGDLGVVATANAPKETGLACDITEEENVGFRLE